MIELHNTDCMEYMRTLPDKAFELAIVDPPYGIGNFSQANKNKRFNKRVEILWNDQTPSGEYFYELQRVSCKYIIWGENYYKKFITDPGTIVWTKGNNSGVGSEAELAATNIFERVVIYHEKWTGFVNSEQAYNKIHPCQKPIKLYKWLLSNYASPGDRILDTHLGSGSIAIACHDMGFDLVGCELDKGYYEAACKRLKNHQMQQKLF